MPMVRSDVGMGAAANLACDDFETLIEVRQRRE